MAFIAASVSTVAFVLNIAVFIAAFYSIKKSGDAGLNFKKGIKV